MQQSAQEIADAIGQYGSDHFTDHALACLSITTFFVANVVLFAFSRTASRADVSGARQTRSTLVSAGGVRWGDVIKDDVSEMLSLREECKSIDATDINVKSEVAVRRERIIARMRFLRCRIELKSNSKNPKHRELIKLLDQYVQL